MAKTPTNKKKTVAGKQQVNWAPGMPWSKFNYILMLIGFIVLGIGYILLSGGGSDNPAVFSEAIFDTRRLVIAPITLMTGFLIEFAAIMVKFKSSNEKPTPTSDK